MNNNNFFKTLVFLPLLLLFPLSVSAQTLSGVSTTTIHVGEVLTITGSNFAATGTKQCSDLTNFTGPGQPPQYECPTVTMIRFSSIGGPANWVAKEVAPFAITPTSLNVTVPNIPSGKYNLSYMNYNAQAKQASSNGSAFMKFEINVINNKPTAAPATPTPTKVPPTLTLSPTNIPMATVSVTGKPVISHPKNSSSSFIDSIFNFFKKLFSFK
jgi:hypothetical protein